MKRYNIQKTTNYSKPLVAIITESFISKKKIFTTEQTNI